MTYLTHDANFLLHYWAPPLTSLMAICSKRQPSVTWLNHGDIMHAYIVKSSWSLDVVISKPNFWSNQLCKTHKPIPLLKLLSFKLLAWACSLLMQLQLQIMKETDFVAWGYTRFRKAQYIYVAVHFSGMAARQFFVIAVIVFIIELMY